MSHTSGHGRGRGMPPLGRETAPPLRSARSGSGESVEIFSPRSHASSDSRVSSRDLSELVSRFQALSTTSGSDKLVRPGFGTRGTQVTLRANMFKLNYPEDVVLYDYVIKIEPAISKGNDDLRRHIVALFEKSKELNQFIEGIAHDGARRLIAKLPMPRNFHVKVPVRENVGDGGSPVDTIYTVSLAGPKELKSEDLSCYLRGEILEYNPLPIVSAFNLIVTAHAARTGARASGKHAYFFNPRENTGVQTRSGIAVVNGFFATVRPVFKSLLVNVKTCMSAFYIPRQLSDAMLEFQQQSQGALHPQKFFGKMRITTTYLGYPRRNNIKGFASESARRMVIRTEEFGKVTVEKYFQKKYRITLKHADDLPVVNVGAGEKDVFVPAELVKIEPGTLFSGKLTRRENAALCAANCKTPAGNAQTITVKGLQLLGLDGKPTPLSSFGVKVSLDMAVISARVLPAPKVSYKSNEADVLNGSWSSRGVQLAQPAQLKRLAVIVLKDGDSGGYAGDLETDLRGAIKALLLTCRSSGMNVDPDYQVRVLDLPRPSTDDPYRMNALDEVGKVLSSFPGKPNLVLALVSNRDPHINAGIRRLFDIVVGCQSACCLISNILDKNHQAQYLMNLALKINAKLGGVNHMLAPNSLGWLQNTMLVGMDVTYPSTDACEGTPSIAAVAASCDATFARYAASVALHESKEVPISNLRRMIIERFKEYREHMGEFPDRVVVFRGGVSSGQAEKVMQAEVAELKKTFREMTNKPRLTYIVCSKGHNVRFYPTRAADADKTSNATAGTVVDQGVTGIYDFDFYLQAHSASQGMARATHYTVMYDENKFSPDVVQQGINDLSHLWAPATKSVSLVPPAYWADRACARARLYIHRVMSPAEGSREKKLSKEEVMNRAKGLWDDGVHEDLKDTMYFM